MKQYETRTHDLKRIIARLEDCSCDGAARHDHDIINGGRDYVLVIHEWESEEEADKARLDWLEVIQCIVPLPALRELNGSVRKWIDRHRNAPKPTVTVIATAEGVK